MISFTKRIVLVAGLLVVGIVTSFGQLVINEFMAANSSAINDPDFDDSGDWVELYNGSASDIDLTGYFLTDNLSDTLKWGFPDGTLINAGDFLLIWADGYNQGLHTLFKLSSIGEEIGLYDNNLSLVDGFIYSAQDTDVSYGRTTDGATTWSWFDESTPSSSNNPATAYEGITFYETFFSIKGGFYSAAQQLELSSLGGTIHYTLDGRTPTALDPVYTEPIEFNESTFVRARVFQDNYIPGPAVTHSYFFDDTFAERGLPVVSLVTDPDFFWDADTGIYVQDFKPEWEHPVNIEFFENDGNNQAVFNERAGVKVNGQNSWELPQKMLGIYFRNEYGSGNLDYPLFHDRERSTFDDIILRAGGSDWSLTLMRDALCQSLTQENAPVGNQGFRQSIVFVNGEYMGISNIRSRLNGDYVEENYGLLSGTYDLMDNDLEVDEGTVDQAFVMDSLFNTDLSIQENFDELAAVVDIENYTDYWITEIWCSNSSWGHNVKYWKPHDGGKWQFLLADLDRGFSGSTNDPISGFSAPTGFSNYDYARYWMQSMFQNEDFVSYFSQRFNDHIYTTFHPNRVNEVIDQFEAPLLPEIAYHVERWSGTTSDYGDGIVSVEFWEDQMSQMRQFAEERHAFMMTDIQSQFGLANIANLGAASWPAEGGRIRLNEFMIPDLPWNGPYFEQMPATFTAIPNPGYEFIGWSTLDLLPLINFGEDWKYDDTGTDLGTTWVQLSYDDNLWAEGAAELGYGDGDEVTVVDYGADPQDKNPTTYFRKTFDYAGETGVQNCILTIRRDDGAAIYLNGQEIARSNMPQGEITYDTYAPGVAGGDAESEGIEYLVEVELLNGSNVLAVEIHQNNGASSDISFDATFSVLTPSDDIFSNELSLPFTLTGSAGYVAQYEPTGACILPAEIAENTTLTIDCSPYLASGDTYVLPNVSLTIDPGVEIWFPENARLIVQGDLQANGTENQGVLLKANTNYGTESWGNLTFENCTGSNHLYYTELRDATQGPHPVHHRAAISGWFSEVIMDHMTLTTNFSNPIFSEYSDITLTNSFIHSDVTGDLINVKYGDGLISDCEFIGNDQPDTDAIDYDDVVDGVIRNSRIEGFRGFNSDGIDLGEESQNILVENCLINDCTDKGISIGQSSTAVVQNNTIVNCNLGLGIKDLGAADIDHTTFYSNVIAIAAFEKNPGFGGGTVNVSNSILSNSSLTPLSVDGMSAGLASNCFYDTDTLPGATNTWMDPLFENPTYYNFNLQADSPALLAGMDGEDLGTLDHSFDADPKIMISDIQYFHPVDADIEFIKIHNSGSETIDLEGYTVSTGITHLFTAGISIGPGEKIMLARDITWFPDEIGQIYQWDSGQLANEGELLLLTDNSGIVVDHVEFKPESPWPIITLADNFISLTSPELDNHFGTNWFLEGPPVSVVENSTTEIIVYPNPASDVLMVQSNQTIQSLVVYAGNGQQVLSLAPIKTSSQIDIKALSPGVYTALVNGILSRTFVKF